MRYFAWENGDGQQFQKVPADEEPAAMGVPPGAVEVPRLPKDFERWEGSAFTLDKPAKARKVEEDRLRGLSPLQRQEEAIQAASERITGHLRAQGLQVGDIGPQIGLLGE